MAKTAFRKDATEVQRSSGTRRRYKGNRVTKSGYPVSYNQPAGGESPRYDKKRGRKMTKYANFFWERNGKRAAPPATWVRGWQ